jgi:hypothetical protein
LKKKKNWQIFPRCYSPKKIAKLVKLTLEKKKNLKKIPNVFGKKKRQIFVPQKITDQNMEENIIKHALQFSFIEIR